ncbi:MAG: UDP-2,3-diacylglucosamine diphosphatase LpxI [Proteobacteria bacterium]|nr:UDP-2,3-diacylglucosamine diphosphatase LpxI [Pseudomonadota bacterium]
MTALGIIAGGGELPLAIAESVRDSGRDVFVLALPGAEEALSQFACEAAGIGELGKSLSLLKQNRCAAVTFAGRVARPDWRALKLDARGALALPKIAAAALKGDDALMRAVLGVFEKEGFRVIGTAEAAPDLIAAAGVYGRHAPDAQALEDIRLARTVVRRLGELDIGQAAAVADGLVLAVEAAEGTDAMLQRLPQLAKNVRGTPQKRRGVLVKAPKPAQDRRVDLPVIGVRTIALAAEGGLAGVAVEAGAALIMRKAKIVEAADALGLFVMAFDPTDAA